VNETMSDKIGDAIVLLMACVVIIAMALGKI
jgi:hypothetical protein